MFSTFYYGLQQDVKLFLVFPLLCGILRFIFILTHHPYGTLRGRWHIVGACMRYGFWWGMDYNAYVFLVSMIVVSLPSAFIPAYAAVGDWLRVGMGTVYAILIYTAYMGKLIFYKHFGDVYNYLIHMGRHGDKRVMADVFFRQDHGWWILGGYILYIPLMAGICYNFLQLPSLPYYAFDSTTVQYLANIGIVLLAVLGYYWFRYGGTFSHDDKPEWDTIPTLVKEDVFLAKATVDDLVALKWVKRKPLTDSFLKSDEEINAGIERLLTDSQGLPWDGGSNPLSCFTRQSKGEGLIAPPKHIFFIVGESIPQWVLDPLFADLHCMDGIKGLAGEAAAWTIPYVLPGGNISRPSIVSLMSGVYDAQFELNEREPFWHCELPTSFARQMKSLGYRSIYWYGGSASNGNFNKFGKAQGFDEVRSALEFCGPDAPRTWVGVYDDVFLQSVADQVRSIEEPTFHFIYTTSNHGPYKIPSSVLDFDPERDIPNAPKSIKEDKRRCKMLATARYADRALTDFVNQMRAAYPDSLFIITGDHSNPIGELAGTEFLPRDWTIAERYSTLLTFLHPSLAHLQLPHCEVATHMQIMPTVLDLLSPSKEYKYTSLQPSLLDTPMTIVATPQQWIADGIIGSTTSQVAEVLEEATMAGPKRMAMDAVHHSAQAIQRMEDYRLLTAWLMKNVGNA